MPVQYLDFLNDKSLVNALTNLLTESPDYLEADFGQIPNGSLICCDTFYHLYVHHVVCSLQVQKSTLIFCY